MDLANVSRLVVEYLRLDVRPSQYLPWHFVVFEVPV